MTKLHELELAQSEAREKLAGLLDIASGERTDAQKAEIGTLTTEIRTREPEIRAALVAESADERTARLAAAAAGVPMDAETRERVELRNRAQLGNYLTAALAGRIPSGAEADYGAACEARAGEIPIDLWERDRPAPTAETRAATPAPATGTGTTVAPVQPFVFAPSIAPTLGIDMPTAPSGSYSEMTITTALPASAKAKGVDADDTAGALTPVTASPRRISARMSIAVEDVALIGSANFEAALRANVSMALSDAYDDQCINGDGQAPNINGLRNQLAAVADPSAVAGFADFLAAYADQIDGLWASMLSEVAILANVDAYALSVTQFRANSADTSFSAYAALVTGGWRTNARMPDTASTIAEGIVYRMGRPGLRTACHPTWGTISVDDIYTDSRSGQRHFSVHALVGDKVLLVQPDAYARAKWKVAA